MPTVQQLRKLAKGHEPPIKGYSSMGKAALLSKLGMHDDLKAHKLSQGQTKAVSANAKNIAKGNATTRAIVEGRLKRAVARDLNAAKKGGKELSQEEKRAIALKAVAKEAKAIKTGQKEEKPKRGGAKPIKSQESRNDESDLDEYGIRKPKLKQEQREGLRVNLVPSDMAKRPAAADALQIGKVRSSIMGGKFTYDTQDPHEFTLQQYRDAHRYVYGDGYQMRQARSDSKAVDSVKANHEAKVRIALKQGKKVSPEVLQDYPHLIGKRKVNQEAIKTLKTKKQ